MRDWSHLRWIVPETDAQAIALYDRIAEHAASRSYAFALNPAASLRAAARRVRRGRSRPRPPDA